MARLDRDGALESLRFSFTLDRSELKMSDAGSNPLKDREMIATVYRLHPQPAPVAGFLRIGHTGQRRLEALHATGRFPYRRVVFDAAYLGAQVALLRLLKASGCEIVLDPNFAEMATAGRFRGAVGRLAWANSERPWAPADFGPGRNADVAKLVAEFAVRHGFDAVLTSSHLIETTADGWHALDVQLCERLRQELDRLGGHDIAIDYQILTTSALLKDERQRRELVHGIATLPIENVWLRVSGFGAAATGAATRHLIEVLRDLHQFGRPLVADCCGGFPGLAILALGAVGGISHGVGQRETFRASDWKSQPGGGGNSRRVYVPDLDRHFTEDQLDAIFEARGGRSRFACNDTDCCPHGREDMFENPDAHFIGQRWRQLNDLARVPETRRAERFLLQHLDPATRSARYAARLKIRDEKVRDLVNAARARLERLRDALGDLHSQDGNATRSQTLAFRGGGPAIGAVLGR
jgi:hypothetical protein